MVRVADGASIARNVAKALLECSHGLVACHMLQPGTVRADKAHAS